MKKLIAAVLIAATTSCAWFQKTSTQAEKAVIDCGKVEVNSAGGGHLATIILDIASQFVQAVISNNYLVTVENLIAVYGEPMVACVIKEFSTAAVATGSGSAGPSTAEQDPLGAAANKVISTKGWQFK